MTELEQQIALCWEWKKMTVVSVTEEKEQWVYNNVPYDSLPDTNSLDVLHEMEKGLNHDQSEHYRLTVLPQVCGNDIGKAVIATAAQRREALLRVLDLWKA